MTDLLVSDILTSYHLGTFMNEITHSSLFDGGVVEELKEDPVNDGILQHCPDVHQLCVIALTFYYILS